MSTVSITYHCPVADCQAEREIPCEYESADPEVGITAGLIPNDDVPLKCDDCGTEYNPEQLSAMVAEIEQECNDWEPEDEPADDDGWPWL